MKISACVLSALLTAAPIVSANAVTVTFQYATTMDMTPVGGSRNANMTVTYAFDSDQTDSNASATHGSYQVLNGDIVIGSDTVRISGGTIDTFVGNSGNGAIYMMTAGNLSGSFVGVPFQNFNFKLTWSTGATPFSDALVTDASVLAGASESFPQLFSTTVFDGIPNMELILATTNEYTIQQLTTGTPPSPNNPPSPVPLPAAFPLFLMALAGLGWFVWRRPRGAGAA